MKKVLVCTLVSALMTGCGGGGSGSDPENTNPNTASGSESPEETKGGGAITPTNQATVLEGTWRKQCGPVEGEEHYDIVTVTFTRSEFTGSIENYTNPGCTTPLQMAPNPTSSGILTVGEDLLLSTGLTATELDTHITQFNGAPFEIDDYTIFYIDNDTLYLGEGEADSPQQRPTSLDYDRPFYRVN